jgi:hypothetical protein
MEASFKNLRIYNAVMGILHLGQGIAILSLSNNFKLPVYTTYLAFNPTLKILQTTTKTLFQVRFGPLVALFLFISAAAHFIIATGYFKNYTENLNKGINKARWFEYALSASLMIVLIGMLSGIYDASSLLMMFGLTAVMNLCGLLMELYNQGREKVSWNAFILGCIAGVIPWIVIAIYFRGAAANGGSHNIPTFVYWIFVSIFLFFNSFALNMFLQYKKVGPWKNYLFGERVYVLLSLTAKSALAWQIFVGTLRPM